MNALILLAAAASSPALEPVIVTATRTESPAGEPPTTITSYWVGSTIGEDRIEPARPTRDWGCSIR